MLYLVEPVQEWDLPQQRPSRVSDQALSILQEDRVTGSVAAREGYQRECQIWAIQHVLQGNVRCCLPVGDAYPHVPYPDSLEYRLVRGVDRTWRDLFEGNGPVPVW